MLKRKLRVGLAAAAVVATVMTLSTTSQADIVPGPVPGLPDVEVATSDGWGGGGYVGAAQLGLAGSPTSRQWARVPLTMMATSVAIWTPAPEASYDRNLDENQLYSQQSVMVRASMVSPKGSKHGYGDSALIPVKTVAFGSVPVEATLQVSQTRRPDGVANMLNFQSYLDTWYHPFVPRPRRPPYQVATYVMKPAKLSGDVFVRLRSLKVDGVDVGLTEDCRTRTATPLKGESEMWSSGNAELEFDPAVGFMGYYGGTVAGSLDIPAFGNCHTKTGEDMSALVSSMLSGPDNPVTIRIGAPACFHFVTDPNAPANTLPPLPGETTPAEADCQMGEAIPGNPRIVVVPEQLPIPGEAP